LPKYTLVEEVLTWLGVGLIAWGIWRDLSGGGERAANYFATRSGSVTSIVARLVEHVSAPFSSTSMSLGQSTALTAEPKPER
jgi:hypothetical protein